MVLSWLALLGCPSPVIADYEAARDAAMRDPGPIPPRWSPDAVLHLSHDMLGTLVTQVIAHYGTLEDEIDASLAKLHPALEVERVGLGVGSCEGCLSVKARLDGTLGVDTAVGDTTVPLAVEAIFDAEVTVDQMGKDWVLALKPRDLRKLDVQLSGVGLGYARSTVQGWIQRNLLTDLPPQPITTFGGDELPLRAVRVVPVAESVQVHLLSAIPKSQAIVVEPASPEGWRLDISPDTLVGIAAARAYEAGPQARDVVAIPTSLSLDENRFTLGLRLWRLAGRGWWRDYEVTGHVAVDRNELAFDPKEARKLGSSEGAAFADPLAALAQGLILRSIAEALQTTLPAAHREDADGLRTRVATRSLTGTKDRITAEGRLVVRPVPETPKKRRKRRRRKATVR